MSDFPPPNYPHFWMRYVDSSTGEVSMAEVNHETGFLYTHIDAFRDRDHIFIRNPERDETARFVGATIFRDEVRVEELGTDFDDVANYMIENDFFHQFKPWVDPQDEIVFQQYKEALIAKELTDLDDYIPDDFLE